MTAANAIFPGYAFAQDFDTEAGAIPADAVLWLNLARVGAGRQVLIEDVELVRASSTRFRLQLTAEQTAPLKAGALQGDFVQRLDAVDTPLGVRVTIPVVEVI